MVQQFRGSLAVLAFVAVASAAGASPIQLPFTFERNDGQTHRSVQYLARGAGYTAYLAGSETVLVLDDERGNRAVRMKLAGANRNARLTGVEPQAARSNYLIGSDPKSWQRNVPHYAKVRYDGVYRGIDAVFYGNERRLEFDFVVAPGANPRAIAMQFDGADVMHVDAAGDLVLEVGGRELRQHKPVAYQQFGGERRDVTASYVLTGRGVGFRFGAYDRTQPLVVDPVITYSSYLGGDYYDMGYGIAVDGAGNTYVTGRAASNDFPTTPGALQPATMAYNEAFVAKLDGNGKLIYSTYLGSNGQDTATGIAADQQGHAYVTGEFSSLGAPFTAGAYQTSPNGADIGVFKLTPMGDGVVYGARVGGTGDDRSTSIALDANNNAIVTGTLHLVTDFPTVNAAQPVYGGGYTDAFLFKLNASGSALVYSTYLGGGAVVENNNTRLDEGNSVAVDAAGNAYVTGFTNADDFPITPGALQNNSGTYDVFVTKFSPSGQIVYSARFGGDDADIGRGIDVDPAGNAYVTGDTTFGYPTTPGAFQANGTFDAFVTKIDAQGSTVVYSTYLGGSAGNGSDNGVEIGYAIAVNGMGEAHVTGTTRSKNFPVKDAIQPAIGAAIWLQDAFVTKLNAAGSALVYSTFLGANGTDVGHDIAVDVFGNVYVTGSTSSTLFPTTEGAAQRVNGSDDGNGSAHDDAFIVKISNATTFHVIAPCRLIDTRGGGAVSSTAPRTIQVAGRCGVPFGATAVAANVTAVTPASNGFLAFYPAGAAWQGTNTVSYRTGRTRATGSVLGLSPTGAVTAITDAASQDFIVDVTGYFQR
ncbi:MAG TPA: SBBP repeat-containing protein [Thermoanaerobaculia bacterium]|jgi:hypothetical protein